MPADRSHSPLSTALAALISAFALSQAFRTVVTLVALPLQAEFGVGDDMIGVVGGAFHLAFGLMQLPVGFMLDRHGPRRTILLSFPAAVAGALVSATASSIPMLIVGQWLVGIGCAPCFLAPLVVVSRLRSPTEFSRLSGIVLGVGGAGMLLTGTPLAWVVDAFSWRSAFWVLAVAAAASWLWCWKSVPRLEPIVTGAGHASTTRTLLEFGRILRNRHMLGMIALGWVTYASFISLRGLWLVPLLVGRHEFTLVASGHLALAGSILALIGPPVAGRLDPGGAGRRIVLAGGTLAYAGFFALLAHGIGAAGDAALTLVLALASGYVVLLYSEVREIWPPAMAGRALAIVNSAMFLGVAAMQWASGVAAASTRPAGMDPPAAAFWSITAMLLAGTALYLLLRPLPAATDQ